jgi:HlyD family secretion protein
MKKILLIALAVIVAAGLVALMVVKQQSAYAKVLTAKVVREDLTTVVSGTGQIKPKTFANLGATAMGRITHLTAREGDRVKKGEVVATVEHVQQQATVSGQEASIAAAKTTIASYVAAEKVAEANVEKAKASLEQAHFDWLREQPLYQAGIVAKADYDLKKATYDSDVATVNQCVASLNQAVAQTASARAQLQTQVAMLQGDKNILDLTEAVAPFDGIVTDVPVREGETVVEGIQNTLGSTFMTIADMSVVTAEVKVDETDIVNIQIGQAADVTIDAIPNKTFKGHVTLVGDQALLRSTGIATSQSTTGTEEAKDFKVVVTLDNPSDDLRPGLSCTAKITTAHKTSVLSLPIQALTMHDPALDQPKSKNSVQAATATTAPKTQPVQGVFVVDKDPHGKLRAHFVPVTTGITGATDIEMVSGLTQNQEIVIGPYKTLRVLKNNSLVKRDTSKPVTPSGNGS